MSKFDCEFGCEDVSREDYDSTMQLVALQQARNAKHPLLVELDNALVGCFTYRKPDSRCMEGYREINIDEIDDINEIDINEIVENRDQETYGVNSPIANLKRELFVKMMVKTIGCEDRFPNAAQFNEAFNKNEDCKPISQGWLLADTSIEENEDSE